MSDEFADAVLAHRYSSRVNADRTVTHTCLCGLEDADISVLVAHGYYHLIERPAILAELQRRHPKEKWVE